MEPDCGPFVFGTERKRDVKSTFSHGLIVAQVGVRQLVLASGNGASLVEVCGHVTRAREAPRSRLTGRFGTEAYTAEELVGEFTAAFKCGKWGFASESRPDHTQYPRSCLKVFANSERAIFSASEPCAEGGRVVCRAAAAVV
jgi:hypothetical protein